MSCQGSRSTFTVQEDLVRIKVQGIPHPKGFPYIPDDQGLVKEILRAQLAETLPSPYRTELVGGGRYIALFLKSDAEKIIAWLQERADFVENE